MIVRLSYDEGIDMRPKVVDYAACRAGIVGFTRDAAAELAPYGIRVNAISPGGVFRNHDPKFVRRYSQEVALGRMAREGFDIKGAAVFRASDAASYVPGESLVVDGSFLCFKYYCQNLHAGSDPGLAHRGAAGLSKRWSGKGILLWISSLR